MLVKLECVNIEEFISDRSVDLLKETDEYYVTKNENNIYGEVTCYNKKYWRIKPKKEKQWKRILFEAKWAGHDESDLQLLEWETGKVVGESYCRWTQLRLRSGYRFTQTLGEIGIETRIHGEEGE